MNKGFLACLVSLSLLLLAACGSKVELKPSSVPHFKSSQSVKSLWTRNIGKANKNIFNTVQPLVTDEYVVAVSSNGVVQAYDPITGGRLWEQKTSWPISTTPVVHDGALFLATNKGEILSIDMDDFSVNWNAQLTSEALSAPVFSREAVYIQTIDGKLFALDLNSGEQRWVYSETIPSLTVRGTSQPVYTAGTLVVGFGNGKLISFNAESGEVLWDQVVFESKGRSALERLVDIDGRFIVAEGIIYAASIQGSIAAVDARSGRVVWRKKLVSTQHLDYDFGQVYGVDESSVLWAYAKDDGAVIWKQDKLKGRKISAVTAVGNDLVVTDYHGYIYVVSQVDGRLTARKHTEDNGFYGQAVIHNETVYAQNKNGHIVAYRISDITGHLKSARFK